MHCLQKCFEWCTEVDLFSFFLNKKLTCSAPLAADVLLFVVCLIDGDEESEVVGVPLKTEDEVFSCPVWPFGGPNLDDCMPPAAFVGGVVCELRKSLKEWILTLC